MEGFSPRAIMLRMTAFPLALTIHRMSSTAVGLRRLLPERVVDAADRRRIAVIPVRGVIGGAMRTQEMRKLLRRARDSKSVRAVVLDIDSPGGSAVASEALYVSVADLAERKPVVAWVRGTGASGAYFLACGATRILAFPGAVVGSIGVISARPVLVEALRRIGAAMLVTKTGPFKDLGAPWREPTDADRAKEQELVDAIFERFTGAVRTARQLDADQLAVVTTGEVWLGEKALSLGLVDATGDEDDALDEAQKLAGLPHKRTVRLERRRPMLQRLGVPGAGMGPPGPRWIAELEGWLRVPGPHL
jgi:protease-4